MNLHVDQSLLKSLMVLGAVVEARDAYTGGHLWRVGQICRHLATELGLEGDLVFISGTSGFLHDLGKIGVPDKILQKPDKLTGDEYAIVKTHPVIGRDLLRNHPLGALVIDAVAHHHERPDGKGYPDGLTEDRIPLIPRIVSVADAFDAMTSTRPYRRGMPIAKAISILEAEQGRQFDPTIVQAMRALDATGTLAHIVGHSDFSIPLASCPNCGPIIVVPRAFVDGDVLYCRNCTGKYRGHRMDTKVEVEAIGRAETPEALKPEADLAVINQLLSDAPATVSLIS